MNTRDLLNIIGNTEENDLKGQYAKIEMDQFFIHTWLANSHYHLAKNTDETAHLILVIDKPTATGQIVHSSPFNSIEEFKLVVTFSIFIEQRLNFNEWREYPVKKKEKRLFLLSEGTIWNQKNELFYFEYQHRNATKKITVNLRFNLRHKEGGHWRFKKLRNAYADLTI